MAKRAFFDGRNPSRYAPEPRRNVHPCHRCGTVTMILAPNPDKPKEPWLWTCGLCLEVLTGRRAAR